MILSGIVLAMKTKAIAYYGTEIYGSATYGKLYGFAVKGYVFDQTFVNREQFLAYVEETGATIINLADKLCLPAQIDSYNMPALMSRFIRLNSLGGMQNPIDAASMIEITLKNTTDEWVTLKNWQKNKLKIDRSFLDRLSSERPIVIIEQNLQEAILNTLALARCISAGMEEFSNEIDPDSGHVKGKAFHWYLNNNCPEEQSIEEDLLAYEDMLISLGVTAVHDTYIQHPEQITAYNNLYKQGRLRLRYRLYTTELNLIGTNSELPIRGLQIFVDGRYADQSAWQDKNHSYKDASEGNAYLAPEDIVNIAEELVEKSAKELLIYTTGYAACKAALDAAQHLKNLPKTQNLIIRLCGFETADQGLLKKARKLGLYLNMLPHLSEDINLYQEHMPKPEDINPLEQAQQHMGEFLSLGAGYQSKQGLVATLQLAMYPPRIHQKLTEKVTDAVPYLSNYPALISNDQKQIGTIDKGLSADFVILNKCPQQKHDFIQTKVIETHIAGQKIYGS